MDKLNLFYFKKIMEVSKVKVIILILFKILIALIPSLLVLASASFIDTAISINQGANGNIYIPMAFLSSIIALSWLSSTIYELMSLKIKLQLSKILQLEVANKISLLKYSLLEDSDSWELFKRITSDPSEKILSGFNNLIHIMTYIITITSLVLVISVHMWWIAIVVVCITLPLMRFAYKNGQINYEAYEDSSEINRKSDYLREVLTSREAVNERVTFNFTKHLNEKWFLQYEEARKLNFEVDKRMYIKTKISNIITMSLVGVIASLLLVPVTSGEITAGMYMGLVTASFQLMKKMSWELTAAMRDFAYSKSYLKDYERFENLEEISHGLPLWDKCNTAFKSIVFNKVSFKYPNTDNYIIKDCNVTFHSNKSYAIVGKNGAGKSTIIKLLTKLYDYEGEILVNGKDLKSISVDEIKAYLSVVHQDFSRYELTIKEYISLGLIARVISEDDLREVLVAVGLWEFVDSLKDKLNTHLGKLNDGIDMSGGQWQKLALARNLVSKAQFVILDEPTAAMDPMSEKKIYDMFSDISKKKSSIIVTHRLGAARNADQIIVLDEGKVSELGNHDELMIKKGLYHNMYEGQRSWYHEKTN